MRPARRLVFPLLLLLPSLPILLPAQEPAATTTATLTQQQQNELRQQAFAAENAQRFAAAADAFLALARAEPMRAEWVVAAGRCLGRSGRFKEAVELLDAGRKRFPGIHEVPAMLARTWLLQAEKDRGVLEPRILWADAAELAEGILAVAPNDEDSRLLLAQAKYLLGDWEAAVAQAEDAVRRHPQRPGAHVLLGRIAGDRLRALLEQHARQQPTGQAAADLVGRIDEQRQAAVRSYRQAAELDPTRPFPHLALAELARLDRKDDVARAHVADALAIDPEVAVDHDTLGGGMTWQMRAEFYAQLGKRYAGGTKPDAAKGALLSFHEGRARVEGSDWAAARACFASAIAANAALTNSHYYVFLCAFRLDDHDAAESAAAAYARVSAPAFADVLRGLVGDRRAETAAVVQYLADRAHQQQRIEASRDLNHVIACLLDSADAWNNHAFLCRETKRYDDALASYQHALEKEPDSPQLLNDTGVILHYHLPGLANKLKAKALYERAIQRADQQLADAKVTGVQRERAAQAKRDATANLQALGS